MIHVNFNPNGLSDVDIYEDHHGKRWPVSEWWRQWKKKSDEAKEAAINDANSNQQHTFREQIWRELKYFLLEEVFHGKCAYCETKMVAGYAGEAEHYRPKGKVTIKEGESQSIVKCEGKVHPGYYWLVYHWKNLLPVCPECNSGNGKMCQFPVKNEHISNHNVCQDPDILDQLESPLLLHPYRDYPNRHIRFLKYGLITEVDDDEKGSTSIEVYNLSRGKLNEERYFHQKNAARSYFVSIAQGKSSKEAKEEALEKTIPYIQACEDFINQRCLEILAES